MNWTFLVIRDNSVEQIRSFSDFWAGCEYTDNFIRSIDPNMVDMPAYNRGEHYHRDDLTVGLYSNLIYKYAQSPMKGN